jgi:6-phosphogluconolactonase/glucosamine-6-phosphate isomerase/deaminase
MNILKTNDPGIPGNMIAERIKDEISQGKKVLWFVAGGSSMHVALCASRSLSPNPLLTILLTDERYGLPGDKDSNEAQLKKLGFTLPIDSVLLGDSKEDTILHFARSIEKKLSENDFILGLFGVGADGHVAGIMPESPATLPDIDYAIGYQAPTFYRLTMTPKVMEKFDAVYLWMQGSAKKEAFERLQTAYEESLQPGQYLKRAKEFTIFTDIE